MVATEEQGADERSPLVSPTSSNGYDVPDLTPVNAGYEPDFSGLRGHDDSKSTLYLFLLTLSIGGLQIVWSVEMSNGSPYLLSLGMSKSFLAFVWIAGPLTGCLVQPYVGIRSDNCRISWGKRKPFMIVGGAATIVSLLILAWVREIVGGFLQIFGVEPQSTGSKTVVIIVATLLMYCLDFSINTVQAGIRAFIVDNAPAHQQEAANAWASRLTGVGNILGFILGYLDLPKTFHFFGNTQFKVLCVIASISLGSTLAISCSYIKERDPRLEGPPPSTGLGLVTFFKQVMRSIRKLPAQIAKVCEVQIAAWVGWFPVLFYSTTYIGQLYVNPYFDKHRNLTEDELNKEWEEATRIGALALLINATITFFSSIIVPLLVVPTYKRPIIPERIGPPTPPEESNLTRRMSFSSMPFGTSSEPLLNGQPESLVEHTEKRAGLAKLQIPGFTIRWAWLLAHVLFSVCMFSTFFINSYQVGSVVIGLVGISWAMTLWAPFALISAEVAHMDAERRIRKHQSEMAVAHEPQLSADDPQDCLPADDEDLEDGRRATLKKTADDGDGDGENLAQAGIILGLHNVAISSPQVISSLVSSAIFKALQKPRGEPWDDSVGWVLRFGGCATLIAAWLTTRLADGPSGR